MEAVHCNSQQCAIENAAVQYVRNNMPDDNKELVRIRNCSILDDGCYDEDVAAIDFFTLTASQLVSLTSQDNIINCYMRIMSEDKNKSSHIHMVDTMVVSWLMQQGCTHYDDLDLKTDNTWQRIARAGSIYRQCEMMFLPVNGHNFHWYLVVLNFKREELQILDPMIGQQHSEAYYEAETKDLRWGIQLCLGSTFVGKSLTKPAPETREWPVSIIHHIPKSSNRNSCGLFCLKYMQLWDGDNIKIPFSQADVDLFRNNLVSELIFSDLNVTDEAQRAREDIIRLSFKSIQL